MNLSITSILGILSLIGAGAGFIFALGKWASKRESASNRIARLEQWRDQLYDELDAKFVSREVMELRLQSIERTSTDTNQKVGHLDKKVDGLLVMLAQYGRIERRQP